MLWFLWFWRCTTKSKNFGGRRKDRIKSLCLLFNSIRNLENSIHSFVAGFHFKHATNFLQTKRFRLACDQQSI